MNRLPNKKENYKIFLQLRKSKYFTHIYLDKKALQNASLLSNKRLSAYSWIGESKYTHSTKRSNDIGSYGEIGMNLILKKNKIKTKKLYENFSRGKDLGDIQVGDLYIEIKTRTLYDWKKFGNQTPIKQIKRYKNNGLNVVYVWLSFNKKSNKIQIESWNKLEDFKNQYIDTNNVLSTRGEIYRDPISLISLCFNRQTKHVNKKMTIKLNINDSKKK